MHRATNETKTTRERMSRPVLIEAWHAPAAVESEGRVERYCQSLLPADELQAAQRFRVLSARNQHIVGRAMARQLLSRGRYETQQIVFETLPHGKPIVRSPRSVKRPFNVAHTRGLVLCGLPPESSDATAADDDQWIGIDVECEDRTTDPGLARRYFAPLEIKQLDQTKSAEEYRALFLKLWTLKESFIKAIGTGLYTPLDQFGFVDARTPTPTLWVREPALLHQRTWQFRSFCPRPGFIAAAAIGHPEDRQPSDELRIESHDFQQWISDDPV